MAIWEWLLDAVGMLLLLVVAYFVCLMVRRRVIARHGGTFELANRVRTDRSGRGWVLGVGRYSGDQLEWFRVFSLRPSPARVWARSSMAYHASRAPEGDEEIALYPGHVVVQCDYDGDAAVVDLAMSPASLIGFQAWLESHNPGTDWNKR